MIGLTPEDLPFRSLPTIAAYRMRELMPDAEFYMISLREVVFESKLGLGLQTGPCHCY